MKKILSYINQKRYDLKVFLRLWLIRWVFKNESFPTIIKTCGRLIIPIFAVFFGAKSDKILSENFFSSETLIASILLVSIPSLLFFADALEKKTPSLKKLGELSTELREIVNFYPSYGDDLNIETWKKDFLLFSTALEYLVCLIISDLESKKVPAIQRKYHIGCNMMIYTKPELISEEEIIELLNELDGDPNKIRNLYHGIDEEKNACAYLLMAGLSPNCYSRDYTPSYVRVLEDERATYPGAPFLVHDALEESAGLNLVWIPDLENFDDFAPLVSEEAKARFKEIFEERKDHVKSFASLPIYWEGILIGCLNIESHIPNFLDFKLDKALEYTLNVIRPVAEVFAYEFNINFISKGETKPIEDQ
ncbi:MAG: hypothetical protein ABJK11_11105 [Balneola sp.]